MAEQSAISWTDATYNPWIGCTKVSPGCDNCYAARDNERRKWVPGWGAGVPRHRTKTASDVRKWDKQARLSGKPLRVFCASLADVFDNEVPQEWRDDLWTLIRETPNLRWLLLTKRIGNVPKMLPRWWPLPHVGLMATMVNQAEFDRDIQKLLDVPAAWRGISMEPMLGLIDISDLRIDWIITGGESGPAHRFTDPAWIRSMRDQCAALGIAFHHKQWGGTRPKENGCEIDGVEHKAFPEALAA